MKHKTFNKKRFKAQARTFVQIVESNKKAQFLTQKFLIEMLEGKLEIAYELGLLDGKQD